MKNKTVITIARQFGSGGREIGQIVAEKLGIKAYDRELITLSAQKSGMSADILHSADEKAGSSLLYTLAMGSNIYGAHKVSSDIPINDKLFITQSNIIKQLAESESCVIIGRSGDYVLRDCPNLFSIFVYADIEDRIARVCQRHAVDAEEANSLIVKTDKRRKNYYNYYTGRKWGHFDNYSMSINSSVLGIEKTAQAIADIVRMKDN